MSILLIETTSRKIEFGFADENKILIKKYLDSESNADSLIYIIKTELDKCSFDIGNVDVISLSNGPGSFTGLRIGSAVAKGICLANDCKLICIPSFDIIANKIEKTENKDFTVLIFTNSMSNEFYCKDYSVKDETLRQKSEHYLSTVAKIKIERKTYIINEEINIDFKNSTGFVNVMNISGIKSQYELTKEYILNDNFTDYRVSEPYYIKSFYINKKFY